MGWDGMGWEAMDGRKRWMGGSDGLEEAMDGQVKVVLFGIHANKGSTMYFRSDLREL